MADLAARSERLRSKTFSVGRSITGRGIEPEDQGRKDSLVMRTLLVIFALITVAITPPFIAAQKVDLTVDVSKAGAKIDRNIFGQFAEHLGHGVYEGI